MIHSLNPSPINLLPIPMNTIHCNDQLVGEITFNGKTFEYNHSHIFHLTRKVSFGQTRVDVNYSAMPTSSVRPKIVVLLESPHIEEFNVSGQPYKSAPAWGKTGDRFNNQFIKVLNNNIKIILSKYSLQKQTFDVYIVNAIQYQCSLGISPINQGVRNGVFAYLWNLSVNSFCDDLIERLNFINPDLLINACTAKLKYKYCNVSTISHLMINKNIAFYTASSHMSMWGRNTILS